MEENYCRRCGSPLEQKGYRYFVCEQNHQIYINPRPTNGIFIFNSDGNALLSRRGIEPGKGMLDTFGGFIELDETAEQSAMRELKEETGLTEKDYEPLRYLASGVGKYPFDGDILPVLTFFYWTRLIGDTKLTAADDVAEIIELPLNAIDPQQLHSDDVRTGLTALKEHFEKENSHGL